MEYLISMGMLELSVFHTHIGQDLRKIEDLHQDIVSLLEEI